MTCGKCVHFSETQKRIMYRCLCQDCTDLYTTFDNERYCWHFQEKKDVVKHESVAKDNRDN